MSNTQVPFTAPQDSPELIDVLNLLRKNIFFDLNCHHIGTVKSFDADAQTIVATINYTKTVFILNPNTQVYAPQQLSYPPLLDVPVVCLGGGGFNLTFPIAVGDQCLLLFNDRSIDNWFQSGQAGVLNSARAHSLADALAIVGLNSMNTSLANYSTTSAFLRNKAGTTGVKVDTKITLLNATTTLNTLLQQILIQLETLANTPTPLPTVPINPAVATALATLATSLGELLG